VLFIMVNSYTFDNGLKLIVKQMDGLLSVTMGILVGVGGAYESDREDGISHYIEHMQFKGTNKRNAQEISVAFDNIGAQVNAFTSKDITCYYSKATSARAEQAFEILSDLFLNSTFPEEEAVREKGVIVEEIAMNEDTPDDLCLDLLSNAMYGKSGYGRNILGPVDNVKGFTKADVDAYKAKFYRPENIVISFAGAVSFAQAKAMVEQYFSGMAGGKFIQPQKQIVQQNCSLFKNKPIEQAHLAIGYPGVARASSNLEAVQIMNTLLGSGMSSRLFQEVREKLGLAYSVYSYSSHYRECGHFSIYAGVNPKNITQAYEAILQVIQTAKKEGVSKEEFSRAREQLRSGSIFSQESTSSQMLWYGRNLLLEDKIDSFEALQERYDRVTLDDVMQALENIFNESKRSVALVGNVSAALPL
ncbi:MAG: insulinase family protein, partial [Clostridia bacterium]|nr:insulinase family protein [Clostridia bacterium]